MPEGASQRLYSLQYINGDMRENSEGLKSEEPLEVSCSVGSWHCKAVFHKDKSLHVNNE